METKETKQTRESKSETDADDTLKPTKEDDTKRHKKGEDDDGKGKGKDDELETERLIYHYHYCSWPDMDVPSNGNDLIEMMQEAEKKQRERIQESKPVESLRGDYADEGSPPFPMVVHCSAGIGTTLTRSFLTSLGRAGTYILIHTALSYAQDNDYSDYSAIPVKDVVAKLRQQRGGMIQTKVRTKRPARSHPLPGAVHIQHLSNTRAPVPSAINHNAVIEGPALFGARSERGSACRIQNRLKVKSERLHKSKKSGTQHVCISSNNDLQSSQFP